MSGTASVQAAGAGLQVVFGRGPVGCAAAKALLGRGLRVLMVSRSGARPEEALTGSGRLDTLAADALDPDAVKAASRGATHLYHCMNVPYQHWERTLAALQGSLAAAAEAQGAVLAVAENLYSYSRGVPVIDETTAEEAPTRKGRLRKRLHESLVAEATATGLRWVAVRASDYYGPGANEQSVSGPAASWILSWAAGAPPSWANSTSLTPIPTPRTTAAPWPWPRSRRWRWERLGSFRTIEPARPARSPRCSPPRPARA